MGILVDGKWLDDEKGRYHGSKGQFNRPDSPIRSWITQDGSPGPTGEAGFKAEANRYHLYVAINCPWAHRTIIFRLLKKLEDLISISYVKPVRGAEGWMFDNRLAIHNDSLYRSTYLHELYTRSYLDYTGRVSVPMLWDKHQNRMVNNESSEIIRMFNSEFNALTDEKYDYYPEHLRDEIDSINELIYKGINNGVYRAGYARTQAAHEEAVIPLFETLDILERRLQNQRYLIGNHITEADWRLFPTLVRFDAAYVGAFKCNIRQLRDYPNLWAYTRDLYQLPGISTTIDIQAYKDGYYAKSKDRNPLGIVPLGPSLNFDLPHGREKMASAQQPVGLSGVR